MSSPGPQAAPTRTPPGWRRHADGEVDRCPPGGRRAPESRLDDLLVVASVVQTALAPFQARHRRRETAQEPRHVIGHISVHVSARTRRHEFDHVLQQGDVETNKISQSTPAPAAAA